ncbi:MAG TPA: hypothetical protein VKA54_01960 [Gemmatimonadaceae bacterium]|nr:hypothetical protein [Gemmatimonadaceae bacterium]
MTTAQEHEIPAAILRSPIMRQGGFGAYDGMIDANLVGQLRAEAARNFRDAVPQTCDCDDYAEGRGGTPRRSLLTAEGGAVQDDIYRSPAFSESLSDTCGLHVVPSGNRGSFSYYARPGDFLGLHRDVEACDLAVITGLHDDSAPTELSGALVVYPDRVLEPLSAIRARPSDGAQAVKLRVGETVVLLGGILPHLVMPVRDGQMRIISVMCFRALY